MSAFIEVHIGYDIETDNKVGCITVIDQYKFGKRIHWIGDLQIEDVPSLLRNLADSVEKEIITKS